MLRTGITVDDDKGKQPKENGWVHKPPRKEVGLDLECTKEKFMEVKRYSLRNLPQLVGQTTRNKRAQKD